VCEGEAGDASETFHALRGLGGRRGGGNNSKPDADEPLSAGEGEAESQPVHCGIVRAEQQKGVDGHGGRPLGPHQTDSGNYEPYRVKRLNGRERLRKRVIPFLPGEEKVIQ